MEKATLKYIRALEKVAADSDKVVQAWDYEFDSVQIEEMLDKLRKSISKLEDHDVI